jgi:hypothetical protein
MAAFQGVRFGRGEIHAPNALFLRMIVCSRFAKLFWLDFFAAISCSAGPTIGVKSQGRVAQIGEPKGVRAYNRYK